MIDREIWFPVKNYVGLYEVSNLGNVRSLDYKHTGQKMILKPLENRGGYLEVQLCKNGKPKHFTIHRLVAEAFIPNWFNDPQVNHLDENKHNNSVDNLEWCTAKYNINYGTHNERMTEKQSKPVLQFTKTGELVREWSSTAEAGRNGFYQANVVSCCKGRYKSHCGFIWKYK